jgi:hypothetical protein
MAACAVAERSALRVNREGGQIVLRDRPGPFWALGLLLLSGAALALAMPLGLATNSEDFAIGERLIGVAIGLGVGAGALWWLVRNPGTRVQLDLTRRHLRLLRVGLGGRRIRRIDFQQIDGVQVEQGTDSDGCVIWRPAVRLKNGELLLLSELWSHDEKEIKRAVAIVAQACA